MAKIKFSSFIRRINRRISGLAKRFGTKSTIYQDAVSSIDASIPESNKRYKDGVLQIAKPTDLERQGISKYILDQRLEVPTPTEIVNQYKNQYESYAGEDPNAMPIDEFIQTMDKVRDTFNQYFDSSQIMEKLVNAHGDEDLSTIEDDVLKKGVEALQTFMNQREEEAPQPSYEDFVNLAKVIDKYGI